MWKMKNLLNKQISSFFTMFSFMLKEHHQSEMEENIMETIETFAS